MPSKLIVYIEGGNRINGFANELVVKGYGRDPDILDELESISSLTYSWICTNLNTDQDCGIALTGEK